MTLLARLKRLFPELPEYSRRGDLVIAQAVVLRPGPSGQEVLLVRRTSPCAWELPGGYVDAGEVPEGAVVREVREETGLDVRIERLLGWYERTGFRPHRSPVFVCTPLGGTLRSSSESYDVRFHPIHRLPLGLFPWYRPLIRDAAVGVTYAEPQREHLGVRATVAAGLIHVAEVLGLLH